MMRQQQPQQQAMRFADAFASVASLARWLRNDCRQIPSCPSCQPMMTSAWSRASAAGLVASARSAAPRCATLPHDKRTRRGDGGCAPPHLMGGVQPHGWAGLDVPAVAWVDEWLSEVNS